MTKRHHISHADEIYQGAAYHKGYNDGPDGRRGVIVTFLTRVSLGTPAASDADGICSSQTTSGAADLSIDGALASSSVVDLSPPRGVVAVSSDAGDTSQTVTVTGEDEYGHALVEELSLNGTTNVNGAKAFGKITNVAVDASLAGNITVGTTDVIGLPFKMANKRDVLNVWADDTEEKSSSTLVAAVTTDPATATTGDVRGTVNPNTAADGSVEFVVDMIVADRSSSVGAFGVAQYGG